MSLKIFTYAGIGSRATPKHQIDEIMILASKLSRDGWRLTSGGALGADAAFASVTPHKQRTIYLPWTEFNSNQGSDCHLLSEEEFKLCYKKASQLHPAWSKCSRTVKKLHSRNVAIILGPMIDKPVDVVVCWTPNGAIVGGTGMGIRIAMRYGIPVFNLGNTMSKDICNSLSEIKQNYYEDINRGIDTEKDNTKN